MLLGSPLASAESPVRTPETPPAAMRALPSQSAVSGSPRSTYTRRYPNGSRRHRAAPAPDERTPLTRAATQQRIQQMSPMTWLTQYGPVRVGDTD